jgi:hypothetical protein
MKTALFLLCLFCAASAMGHGVAGAGAISSEPQIIQLPSHPVRAVAQPMAREQDLLISSGYTSARGERPLWDVPSMSHEVPLGDVAREFRKEHALVKKATITLEK